MKLANKLTMTRIFLIPVFVLFATPMHGWVINNNGLLHIINKNSMGIAVTIFILASITDKLDGYIARKYNQVTKFGCLMDPLADKLMVASALFILLQQNKIAGWVVLVILTREFAVTALRLTAASNKIILSADKCGKIKLVFQVTAITLCFLNNYPFSLITNFRFDSLMMYLTVIITVYSGINYFVKNKEIFFESGKLSL